MKKCKYCGSVWVCWNWFKHQDGWGHECWKCGNCQETVEKVKDGIPYFILKHFYSVFNHYLACEFCSCDDCIKGTYRNDSWFCPVLHKQICDICCIYDMEAIEYTNIRKNCKQSKCKHYKEI